MFYTYAHYTPSGSVFYIGKGTKDRAFSRSDRSYLWREVVKKERGLTIQILADWETEEDAYSHEQLLIDCFKSMGYDLVNAAIGGPGPKGFMQSPESRAKKRQKMVGYKYQTITCPKCGQSGGETSMKRWHFENCSGLKKFKARATVNGKRVFLGNHATKEDAEIAVLKFKEQSCHSN